MTTRCLLIFLLFASAGSAFAEEQLFSGMPPAAAEIMKRQFEQHLRLFRGDAQAPGSFGLPAQTAAVGSGTLPLDLTLDVARAALKSCRDQGYMVSVSVVDSLGNPKVSVVDDGASPSSRFENEKKLSLVYEYGKASSEAAQLMEQKFRALGTNGLRLRDAFSGQQVLSGGMPLSVKGKRIGAVAVSGAAAGQDENCARAALNEIGGLDAP